LIKILIKITESILGPTIGNLGNLIRMPGGCSEQVLITMAPALATTDYLKSTNQLTPGQKANAEKSLNSGYQQEIKYKHTDGSYSTWGGGKGSTWLTAFVCKIFNQASDHIYIDRNVIKQGFNWVASKQSANGEFPEVGQVAHREMQGEAAKGIPLTGFTLVAFLENTKTAKRLGDNEFDKYKSNIDRAANFLANNLQSSGDVYAVAIATYALLLHGHPKADTFFEKLKGMSRTSNEMTYWKKSGGAGTSSVDRETTGYALLAYLEAAKTKDAILEEAKPIMKWLVNERNAKGGFQSTQETVVGLQALSQIAKLIYDPNTDLHVYIGNDEIRGKRSLPVGSKNVDIKMKGQGVGLVQVSYQYNVISSEAELTSKFEINPEAEKVSSGTKLNLKVCTRFRGDGSVQRTNMGMMEIAFPSGFAYDLATMKGLIGQYKIDVIPYN
jgi:CD109 antigen